MYSLEKLLHKKIDFVEEGQLKGFAADSAERDKVLRFAVIKNLEIIGEAAYLLSKKFTSFQISFT